MAPSNPVPGGQPTAAPSMASTLSSMEGVHLAFIIPCATAARSDTEIHRVGHRKNESEMTKCARTKGGRRQRRAFQVDPDLNPTYFLSRLRLTLVSCQRGRYEKEQEKSRRSRLYASSFRLCILVSGGACFASFASPIGRSCGLPTHIVSLDKVRARFRSGVSTSTPACVALPSRSDGLPLAACRA
jgi:hypothetical protein